MADLIKRQDAIDVAIKADIENNGGVLSEKRARIIDKRISALPSAQAEEVLEIGKPHPLKGYEFCIFKDAYGDDWVEIRKYQDQRRGEQDG